MDAEKLLIRLAEFGGDADGIRDRFCGNTELFARCFYEFLAEPGFDTLSDAVDRMDYKKAFEAAHALKGVSGNLGLTAFYTAVSGLVEVLRAGDYANVPLEYVATKRQHDALTEAFSGNPPDDLPPDKPQA